KPDQLDVLFVLDASPSTAPLRRELFASVGDALFTELQVRLNNRLPDLQLGVITTEIAHDGLPLGCDGSHAGELRSGQAGCPQVPGHYLIVRADAQGGWLGNYTGDPAAALACL